MASIHSLNCFVFFLLLALGISSARRSLLTLDGGYGVGHGIGGGYGGAAAGGYGGGGGGGSGLVNNHDIRRLYKLKFQYSDNHYVASYLR